mgnify:CR=1 FL=1|tara:strand:+ start:1214 stop:3205 length:1992 start_codon:yes stop_codon:yes gene_type:complete
MAAPQFDINQLAMAAMQAPEASIATPFPQPPWMKYQPQGENPETLGIVDQEKAARLSEADIVHGIIAKRKESEAQRKFLEPKWRHLEDLYHFRTRNPDKEDWQSDVILPEFYTKVRVFRSQLQSALMEPEKFFTVINEGSDYQSGHLRALENWIYLVQRKGKLIDRLLDMWEEAAIIGNSAMKVTLEPKITHRPRVENVPVQDPMMAQQMIQMGLPPVQQQVVAGPQQNWEINYTNCPAWFIYPDPWAYDFYSSWCIEENEVDESTLEERKTAGLYDSIEEIGPGVQMRGGEYRSRIQRLELADSYASGRNRHLVTEYVGDIHDNEGHLVCKNWIVTILNEKSIVRIGPNPSWKGTSRYIWSNPIPYPGRPWGRPPMESVAEFQEEEGHLFNLMLDDAKYAVMSAFLLDDADSYEPSEYDTIEPGKVYRGKGEFLRKLSFQTSIGHVWPVLQHMQQAGDKASQISEFVDGTPTSRGRPSAAEVQTKTASGSSYLHNLARRLEENDVERALQITADLLMQFGDETGDPRIQNIMQDFGGAVMQDPVSRLAMLDVPYRVEVRGLSMVANREGLMNKTMQTIQLLMQLGVQPQQIVPVVYSLITMNGMRPEQLGLPKEPEEYMQMMMGMPNQAPGATQGGGGQVPPGGGQDTGMAGQGQAVPPPTP